MSRKVTTLALTLMLLTGIVVGQLSSIAVSGPHPQPGPVTNAADTAHRFYAALNTTIQTGDSSDLRALLHNDFADHSSPQQSGSADDLVAQLIALRQAFPGLRMTASAMVVHNDLVTSSLAASGQITSTAGDLQIDAESTGGYDLLRVVGSKVMERWSSPGLPFAATMTSIALTDLVSEAISGRRLKVEQIEIAPGDHLAVVEHQGTVIVIEAGTIGLTLSGAASRSQMTSAGGGSPAGIEPRGGRGAGEIIAISPADSYRLSNRAPETARLLHITLTKATLGYDGDIKSDQLSLSSQKPDVNAQHVVDFFGAEQNQIVLHLVHLGPRARITGRHIFEMEFLVVVHGTVDATATIGELDHWNQSLPGTLSDDQVPRVIAAPSNAVVNYLSDGQSPATFLLISVLPVPAVDQGLDRE
ncbi:MAG: ester cyclase [Thermomicrobiales bacterium]